MPHYWTRVGTPQDLADSLQSGRYDDFERDVHGRLQPDFAPDGVFFAEGGQPAYVLVHASRRFDDAIARIEKALGSSETVELFTAEELD